MREMDIFEVLKHLPQRYPILMIDKVKECEPGKRILAIKNVSANEPYFQGHFPGQPILPGISQVHMAVLLAGEVFGWAPEGSDLNRVKFKDIVRPGETLDLTLTADRDKGRLAFRWLRVNGGEASSGSIG